MNQKTYLKIDFVIKNSRHSFPNHRKHSEKSVLFGAEPLIPVVLRLFSLIITVLVALWLRKKEKNQFLAQVHGSISTLIYSKQNVTIKWLHLIEPVIENHRKL